MSHPPPFGAILAGGQNRRYGSHKALAEIAGEPIIERVRRAVQTVTPDLVLIANEPDPYARVGLPLRPDAIPGLGALGGIYTALLWAREEARPGILAVACDMPFLSAALLARILEEARTEATGERPDIVTAESEGRRGVEPLCAYYATACIEAIEAELARGERHIVGFYDDVRVRRVPLADVQAFGEPGTLFLNVNTPEERERAEILAAAPAPGASAAD